jgi:hypothetical protein
VKMRGLVPNTEQRRTAYIRGQSCGDRAAPGTDERHNEWRTYRGTGKKQLPGVVEVSPLAGHTPRPAVGATGRLHVSLILQPPAAYSNRLTVTDSWGCLTMLTWAGGQSLVATQSPIRIASAAS